MKTIIIVIVNYKIRMFICDYIININQKNSKHLLA